MSIRSQGEAGPPHGGRPDRPRAGVPSPAIESASRIRAVTFDAGGTLIYPHPSVGEVYAAALRGRGIPADPQAVETRFRAAYREMSACPRDRVDPDGERAFWREVVVRSLAGDCPPDLLDPVFDELYEAYAGARYWKLFPDARSTVEALRGRGYRVFLLSNADHRFRKTFAELGFTDWFEDLFISSEIGWEKPDPRLFDHVRQRIGEPSASILHVGDSRFHDGGAAACGWPVAILGEDLPDLAALLEILPGPRSTP